MINVNIIDVCIKTGENYSHEKVTCVLDEYVPVHNGTEEIEGEEKTLLCDMGHLVSAGLKWVDNVKDVTYQLSFINEVTKFKLENEKDMNQNSNQEIAEGKTIGSIEEERE